jgi:sodium-dependent phosphate cotransporter
MENNQETDNIKPGVDQRWKTGLRNTAYILLALIIFLFTLDLMIASLQHLGKDTAEVIILATSNPFTGLFIGLLVTAIIQSSSATTSMIVAMVASGAITLEGAIPILMGANVGTTITSTIISLGFITRKKEFRRAVTIGTYHDFFNILTVLILFPLEYYFGFLSGLAQYIATSFFNQPIGMAQKQFNLLGDRFGFIINVIVETINNGFLLVLLSITLLFGSILFFRKVLSRTFGFGSQDRFQQFFFRSPMKSFAWGLLTTAAIRSSTVTTSLVVPLVAKKVVKIKSAFPFVLGANIGTTITAFIAAMFNSNAAISIAIAHFLFNLIGVLIFFPIPIINQVPISLAAGLGRLTLKYRLAGFLYVLLTFFVIPFSLIYFNKHSVTAQELIYQQEDLITEKKHSYSIINKTYLNQPITNWIQYEPARKANRDPLTAQTVYRRKNLLLLNNELFELNKPGFCRDGEDEHGKYKTCIREILPAMKMNSSLVLDSVYVFVRTWYQPERVDSTTQMIYISATRNVMAKKETIGSTGSVIAKEELIQMNEK